MSDLAFARSDLRGRLLEKIFRIVPGDLDDPRIVELIAHHHRTAQAHSPPESAHSLDVSGLKSPDIQFWAIWDEDHLLGIGALRRLPSHHGAGHGEIKSMHTAQEGRRRGVASAMLRHIVEAAHAAGLKRLSLETGAQYYFAASRALYRRHGFVECGPYADYRLDPNSVYMTLLLDA